MGPDVAPSLNRNMFYFSFIFTRISYPVWYVVEDFNISLYIYLHTYFISIMVRRWRFQHFYYIHLHTYFISIMVRRWRFQHFSLYLSSHVFHILYGTSLEISTFLFIFIFTRISYPLWYVAGDFNISIIFIFTRISYPLWYVAGDFNISVYIYLHTYFISTMVRR